ncbi:hypothetical protein ACPXAO_23605, partial [Salmonella enterica]|uniref:hypothetical protein n=1 Tax=Salmonella enterica TaxID=28901 RepID=UPI003CFB6EA9
REVTFEHAGVEYTLSPNVLDDVEILEAMEDERYITAVRSIVGRERWNDFKESVRTDDGRVPASELETFLEKVMAAVDPTSGS